MHRITSSLLLGGGVLLTTWVVAPAAPVPARNPVTAADLASLEQNTPALAEVSAQVDRLRDRLNTLPQYPPPARDPFRFGRRPEPAHPKIEPAMPAVVEPPPAPAPLLPRLVALMTGTADGGSTLSAVLAIGDDIQIVKTGDAIAAFTVGRIGADAIDLIDRVSGATFRIALR